MKPSFVTAPQILNNKCYNELMHLRDLLKNFCVDAYSELAKLRELPRPPFNSPLIAGNVFLTHPLSKLSSYKLLREHMHKSGMYNKLQDTGHGWYWQYEVFEWLFLERVIAESYDTSFDIKAFNKVFSYASSELTRNSFRIRRITTLNGLPRLSNTIKLHPGLLLSPVKDGSYDLVRLLYSRFHNKNREPSLWIDSDSSLLVQDRVIVKEDRGNALLHVREQLDGETNMVIKSLKLCLDTPVCPKAVYLSYLSRFPLIPITRTEVEEYSDILFSVQRSITKAEILDIHRIWSFIKNAEEPEYFDTALTRFTDSYRVKQIEQNVVDLIVALEAMLGVNMEELRRRLATNVAFLLGKNSDERLKYYRQVSAGYRIRNAVVHAVRELQNVVRLVLKAYIHMKTKRTLSKWLKDEEDFEYLPFDSKHLLVLQKQLGIK